MIQRDLIPAMFVPTLLGESHGAWGIARRLFWRWGLTTHLFCSRPPLLCRLMPYLICHPLPADCDDDLLALALCDAAEEWTNADRQPLLLLRGSMPLSDTLKIALEPYYLMLAEKDLPLLFCQSPIRKKETYADDTID